MRLLRKTALLSVLMAGTFGSFSALALGTAAAGDSSNKCRCDDPVTGGTREVDVTEQVLTSGQSFGPGWCEQHHICGADASAAPGACPYPTLRVSCQVGPGMPFSSTCVMPGSIPQGCRRAN